jgi:hypothetical protein
MLIIVANTDARNKRFENSLYAEGILVDWTLTLLDKTVSA